MNTEKPIKVLLVEDFPDDARLARQALSDYPAAQFEVEEVHSLAETLARLPQGNLDVLVLDLMLPDSRGLDTLAAVSAHSPGVPIIVLTGYEDQHAGIKALSMGARDYRVKGIMDMRLLGRSIVRQVFGRQPLQSRTLASSGGSGSQ